MRDPGLQQYVLWGIWAVFPVFVLYILFVMHKQRAVFPLSARQPVVIWALGSAVFVASSIHILHRLLNVPCWLFVGLLFLVDNIILSSLFLLGLYILFQFRVIEIINRITEWTATEDTKAAGRNDWSMQKAKKVLTDGFYLRLYVLDFFICAVVTAATAGASAASSGDTYGLTSGQCPYNHEGKSPLQLLRIATVGVKFILGGLVSLRLCAYGADSGMVKTDLKYAAMTGPWALIAHFALLGALTSNQTDTMSDVAHSIHMLWLLLVFLACVVRPAYLTYFIKKDTEAAYYQGRQPDISNLADIINSKVGYAAFVQFLKSEFSEENLLFWREVQTFVNKCQALKEGFTLDSKDMNALLKTKIQNREVAAELCKTAIQIFDLYCKRGAPSQVNISDTVLQELSAQLANLNAERAESVLDKISNLFDSVKSQVFELMDKDSFARFRQSPLYNQLRTRMVTSGWIDTSGGETLDSFDLPPSLITVRDVDEERQKALARKQQMANVLPEAIRQQKKDQRASHILSVNAQMHRRHIMDMSMQTHLKSPVDTSDVVYPFSVDVASAEMAAAAAVGPAKPALVPVSTLDGATGSSSSSSSGAAARPPLAPSAVRGSTSSSASSGVTAYSLPAGSAGAAALSAVGAAGAGAQTGSLSGRPPITIRTPTYNPSSSSFSSSSAAAAAAGAGAGVSGSRAGTPIAHPPSAMVSQPSPSTGDITPRGGGAMTPRRANMSMLPAKQ